MRFVADTSVWIDALAGRGTPSEVERRMQALEYAFATDVICAELLSAADNVQQVVLVSELAARHRVLELDGVEDMRRAGECLRRSRLAGRTVRSMTDCLIAAVCIREEIPLMHDDRDFATLAELTPLMSIVR